MWYILYHSVAKTLMGYFELCGYTSIFCQAQRETAMTDHPDDRNILAEIRAIKKRLKTRLLILTHHYQRSEIVDVGDFRGDSFGRAHLQKVGKKLMFFNKKS